MPPAAFFLLMTLAPSGEHSSPLREPIRLLFGRRLYEARFTWTEHHKGGGRDFNSVSTGFDLLPLESLTLPALKSSWVTKTPNGEVKIEQAGRIGAIRLPFGMFLVTLQIEKRIKEPGKKSSRTTRSTWIRILQVGHPLSVDLGKNPTTGNRRTWDVAIEGGVPQPGQ